MDCKLVMVPQKSDEWLNQRRCRITCSRLGDVMAGTSTKRYQQYQRQIAQELSGIEQPESDAPWFDHGREMEPRALAAYEWKHANELFGDDGKNGGLLHDVFLVHKDYDWLGCSPDGLYPKLDDGIEVKCRALYKNYRTEVMVAEHFETLDARKCVSPSYRFQVQGAMWVTGFESWWYVNYYEGDNYNREPVRKLHRVQIPRDQELIEKMELRCLVFIHECYEIAGITP